MYRSGFLSRVIERKLVEEHIPYEIYGGIKFYQRMEILDIVAYLRVIAYNDDLSFKRIINTPRRKFGRNRVAALEKMREHNEITLFDTDVRSFSLYDILKNHLSSSVLRGSGAGEFVAFIEQMKNLKDKITIGEFVNQVCVDSGYEKYIRELGDEERLENLSEFKRIANEYEKNFGERITLEEFLQQIALMSSEDSDKPCEAVKLMTIHASKGLEFPIVFIIGFSEGIFPSLRSIEERKELGLEEERRLCYVAITRAMASLFLLESEGQNQNGMNKLPSRFLFEIGEENYIRIGKISDQLEKECCRYIAHINSEMLRPVLETKQKPLQFVEHHIFGNGKVLSFDEKRQTYSIQFEGLAQPRAVSAEYFETKHTKLELPLVEEDDNALEEQIPSLAIEDDLPNEQPIEVPLLEQEKPTQAIGFLHQILSECDECDKQNQLTCEKQQEQTEEQEFADYEILSPDEEVDIEEIPIQTLEKQSVDKKPFIEVIEESSTESNDSFDNEQTPDLSKISPELRKKLDEATNHWNEPNFPKTGWICVGVTDLGAPTGICEMCGYQIIRYVHNMYHEGAHLTLGCGCVCAGKMEGNVGRAKRREQALKNKQNRQISFLKKKWKRSVRGHEYLKMKNHIIVLFHFRDSNKWNFSIDGEYNKSSFATRSQAILATFDAIDKIMYQ